MKLKKILNSKSLIIFFIPFVLGSLCVLSFQPFNFTFINFFTLPFLFLILTYVSKRSKNIYRKKPHLSNLFFVGYLFGVGFFLSGNYWISYSLTFDVSFQFLIPFSLILIPLFLGLFFGLSTLAIGSFLKNNFSSILIFCSSLAIADFLRSKILSGFPWNLWAYSWSWFPEVIQLLQPVGLFAFNLLTLTIFCSTLLLFFKNKKKNLAIYSILIILFFSNYIYGSIKINKDKVINAEQINLKIVSPSFDLKYNLSNDQIESSIKKLIKYSEPDSNKETVFIWPEGIFAGYQFKELLNYKFLFQEQFTENQIIILGVNTQEDTTGEHYNSIIAVNKNLDIMYQYNKRKLVPFGEFLPLEFLFTKLGLKKITQGYGSFSKGVEQKNLNINQFNILPLICYEIIFTELIQKSDLDTNLIINISEDAWFGGTIGPQQHFAKAIFRAIESNTHLVRAANKGISAFIDNNGRILKSLEPYEAGSIELNIPLINNSSRNRNDLIFFVLLFTYTLIFFTIKKKYND